MCAGANARPYLTCRDYTVSGQTFAIVQCAACGFRYTSCVPDENKIGRYYKSENYVSHTDDSRGFINTLYYAARIFSLRQKANYVEKTSGKKRGRILDYGCGTGAFLASMRERGWECTGLEPDADARRVARDKHGLELQNYDALWNLPASSFDVVSLWHVLEHVHRLHETTARLADVLRADGVMFVAVPNAEAKDAEIYGEYWAAYDVPRHLYHFSVADVERLAQKHGLKVVEKKTMPLDAFYVSLLSEKYRRGFAPRAIWNGLRSNFAAGNDVRKSSSILYLLRKK